MMAHAGRCKRAARSLARRRRFELTIVNNTTESRSVTPPAVVEVWDQAVRVLYGSLAAYLILAYATGDAAGRVHAIAGYTIAIHLALRIVWGLARQYHAQSCNLVHPP